MFRKSYVNVAPAILFVPTFWQKSVFKFSRNIQKAGNFSKTSWKESKCNKKENLILSFVGKITKVRHSLESVTTKFRGTHISVGYWLIRCADLALHHSVGRAAPPGRG